MYAHSIKNPHTIHFRRKYRKDEYIPPVLRGEYLIYTYLCCGSYTPEKATDDPLKVTCKNCLKILSEMDA